MRRGGGRLKVKVLRADAVSFLDCAVRGRLKVKVLPADAQSFQDLARCLVRGEPSLPKRYRFELQTSSAESPEHENRSFRNTLLWEDYAHR